MLLRGADSLGLYAQRNRFLFGDADGAHLPSVPLLSWRPMNTTKFERVFFVTMLGEIMEKNKHSHDLLLAILASAFGRDNVAARLAEAEVECHEHHLHKVRVAVVCVDLFAEEAQLRKSTHFVVEVDGEPAHPTDKPWLLETVHDILTDVLDDMREQVQIRNEEKPEAPLPDFTVLKPPRDVQ